MTSNRHEPGQPSPLWVEAWRADVAEPLQLRRAYRRYMLSRSTAGSAPTRVAPLQAARWVALGVVLGTGSLLAATRVSAWLAPQTSISAAATSAKPPLPARSTDVPVSQLRPVDSSQSQIVAPAVSVRAREPDPALQQPELWQRASRGLRDRDFDAANAALAELMREGSVSERESARLVQAQVLLAQGRTQDAELSLRTLAESASSPKLRQKAHELLLTAHENLASQRSFPVDGGANQP